MKRRIDKFEKLLNLEEKKLDQIKVELANSISEINRLVQKEETLQFELERVQQQQMTGDLTASRQISSQLMVSLQQRINDLQPEIVAAKEVRSEIMQRYHTQNSKVKSWEKLLEKERSSFHWHITKRQHDEADDRFLNSSPPRR